MRTASRGAALLPLHALTHQGRHCTHQLHHQRGCDHHSFRDDIGHLRSLPRRCDRLLLCARMHFADVARAQARPFPPVRIPVRTVPLAIAARATRCLSTFAILQLVGDMLITWYNCHRNTYPSTNHENVNVYVSATTMIAARDEHSLNL